MREDLPHTHSRGQVLVLLLTEPSTLHLLSLHQGQSGWVPQPYRSSSTVLIPLSPFRA
jgi:hypothetical protein